MSISTSHISTDQIERVNATDSTPVVFVHGLWLLPSSWDRWATVFEEAGYAPLTPSTLSKRTSEWLRRDLPRRIEKLGVPVTVITQPEASEPLVDQMWRMWGGQGPG